MFNRRSLLTAFFSFPFLGMFRRRRDQVTTMEELRPGTDSAWEVMVARPMREAQTNRDIAPELENAESGNIPDPRNRVVMELRRGDWVLYGLAITTINPEDPFWGQVYARFENGRMVEWTTKAPPCFGGELADESDPSGTRVLHTARKDHVHVC